MAAIARSLSKKLTIGLIPADGIGREVIPAAAEVLEKVSPGHFEFIHLEAGFEHFKKTGVALPDETVDVLKTKCAGALFGAVSSPSHKVAGYSSPIVALRKKLDLYANVRPVASAAGTIGIAGAAKTKPIDMLIIRENTECLYIKQERIQTLPDGSKEAWADRKITEHASRRVALMAYKMALKRGQLREQRIKQTGESLSDFFGLPRPRVTVVHKSNVLSVTDGLFRETCLAVRDSNDEFKRDVDTEEQLVDSMVYRMFREPHLFDVAVAPNLYGDIISDAAAALVGSLGVVAGANVGDNFVIGEPVHGSAPDIAGKGIANPIASIRSAALLLEYLSLPEESARIYRAVDTVLNRGLFTPDLGGTAKTTEVTQGVIAEL
ncbi:hypothetical protein BJ742DRAFT_867806 [Cladochytrium replicatum]|nr:hypothetical protein BJ742DRAFT_867806 [Cladochytrium replicatum]